MLQPSDNPMLSYASRDCPRQLARRRGRLVATVATWVFLVVLFALTARLLAGAVAYLRGAGSAVPSGHWIAVIVQRHLVMVVAGCTGAVSVLAIWHALGRRKLSELLLAAVVVLAGVQLLLMWQGIVFLSAVTRMMAVRVSP